MQHNTEKPSTVESVLKLKVKAGPARAISGSCNGSRSGLLVALDGTTVASGTGSGAFYVAHEHPGPRRVSHDRAALDNGTSAIQNYWSAWLPQNARTEGVDTAKIAAVIPGS